MKEIEKIKSCKRRFLLIPSEDLTKIREARGVFIFCVVVYALLLYVALHYKPILVLQFIASLLLAVSFFSSAFLCISSIQISLDLLKYVKSIHRGLNAEDVVIYLERFVTRELTAKQYEISARMRDLESAAKNYEVQGLYKDPIYLQSQEELTSLHQKWEDVESIKTEVSRPYRTLANQLEKDKHSLNNKMRLLAAQKVIEDQSHFEIMEIKELAPIEESEALNDFIISLEELEGN